VQRCCDESQESAGKAPSHTPRSDRRVPWSLTLTAVMPADAAESLLITAVRRGNQQAWQDLIARYEGGCWVCR